MSELYGGVKSKLDVDDLTNLMGNMATLNSGVKKSRARKAPVRLVVPASTKTTKRESRSELEDAAIYKNDLNAVEKLIDMIKEDIEKHEDALDAAKMELMRYTELKERIYANKEIDMEGGKSKKGKGAKKDSTKATKKPASRK